METRKTHQAKFSELPPDYLKMVKEVFTTNFTSALRQLDELSSTHHYFEATGRIYQDEIILVVSLMEEGQIAATSLHASADFDAQASTPTLEDLLSACVDAAGSVFSQLLTGTRREGMERLVEHSLSAFENVPFEWTALQVDRHSIHVKMDKSNPHLDQVADEWLQKNDPSVQDESQREQEEAENLFITADTVKRRNSTKH